MQTDPIADMITRIRNAYLTKKGRVLVPYSKVKTNVAKILAKNKYLESVQVSGEGKEKQIEVELSYSQNKPAITKIIRISKPGRRVYRSSKELPRVLSGMGMAIVSTSQGMMTAREAKNLKLGGEVICKVW